jgi:peptide/nickel transport system substrate-binding protein
MTRNLRTGTLVLGLCLLAAGAALAQKAGGTLRAVQRENPPSLSIHEEATVSTVWPMSPVYNNLVFFNPAHAVESTDDLVGELAEHWTWSDGHKRLTFKLRHGVKWHDGKAFTSADVKYTYDLVRGVLTDRKLRINPRKQWYENVAEIVANGDFEVAFVLKKPQPSLLGMLASGYSPVYPAHIDPAELRTHAVGTGPFRLKEYVPEQRIELVRNPDYFIRGRPYLDGISFIVIKDRTARATAMGAGQVDIFFPQEGVPTIVEQVKRQAPQVVVKTVAQSATFNIVINTKKPPFDNIKVRQAINYALDRNTFLKTQQGGAIAGGIPIPPPYGRWGMTPRELAALPGWGDPAADKAKARKLLAEAGYGAGKPLKVSVLTRSVPLYTDMAAWMIGQLNEVGIEGQMEIIETGLWFPRLARRDYTLGANMMAAGVDDPDAWYFENFACGSPRNYTDFCSKEAQELMEKTSQEADTAKRVELSKEVDRLLQIDVARSMLGHALDEAMYWPYVKGYVPHNNIYNYARMQDVWLDK